MVSRDERGGRTRGGPRRLALAAAGRVGLDVNAAHLTRGWIAREAVLLVGAVFAYFAVRAVTEGSQEQALRNAQRVVELEQSLGFFWEPTWQAAIEGSNLLVTLANWAYIYGHWPVITVVAIWLAASRPGTYRLMRNAFLVSGGIGLIIFVSFPTAPPRLTEIEITDTVTLYSHAYRVLQPPSIVNQYAAVPSLHFGWNLLIGLAVIHVATNWVARLFGFVMPVVMFLAIVLTGNHFIFDGIAGAAVALTGLGIAYGIRRRTQRGDVTGDTRAAAA